MNRTTYKRKVPPRYGRTPHALLEARLGIHANAVFQALAYHDGGGVICPSLATICKVAGLSVNSVRDALKVLVKNGWVEQRELSRKGCMVTVEYILHYELPGRATMSSGDTVNQTTMSSGDTVKQGTVSNHDVKKDPLTMSLGDNKQELLTRTINNSAQSPRGLAQSDEKPSLRAGSSAIAIDKEFWNKIRKEEEAKNVATARKFFRKAKRQSPRNPWDGDDIPF
jgi:hypothetical protein